MSLTDKTFSLGRPSNYSSIYNVDISGTLSSGDVTIYNSPTIITAPFFSNFAITVASGSTSITNINTYTSNYFCYYCFFVNGTITPTKDINVGIIVSGGGGGGGFSAELGGGGGGGGGTVYVPTTSNIMLLAGRTYDILVGSGGNGNLTDGGDSVFAGIINDGAIRITARGGIKGSNNIGGVGGDGSVFGLTANKYTILNGGNGSNAGAGQGESGKSTNSADNFNTPFETIWGGGGGGGGDPDGYVTGFGGSSSSMGLGGTLGGTSGSYTKFVIQISQTGFRTAYSVGSGGGGGGGTGGAGTPLNGTPVNGTGISGEVAVAGAVGGRGGGVIIYCSIPKENKKLTVNGAISKTSGTFDIVHPLSTNKNLIHSFIEGPRCDLIYRGDAKLQNGRATVNIDTDCVNDIECCMELGTFEALCANPMYYLQNHSSFDRVKGDLSGNILTIVCENESSNDTVYWRVIAERKDENIKQWNRTNNNGYLITEYAVEGKFR